MTIGEGFARHGAHRPGSVCFECERLDADPSTRALNCCGSREGHSPDCETVDDRTPDQIDDDLDAMAPGNFI